MRSVIPFGLLIVAGCIPPPAHILTPADVVRVDARLFDYNVGAASDSASSEDPAHIQAVLAALMPVADPPPPHLCAEAGEVVLVRRSGSPIRLGFLPGHDPAYYEYHDRRQSYRVDNARFVAALRQLGLSRVPERCGQPTPVPLGVSAVAGVAVTVGAATPGR
jgi:hypothetical protein